MKATFTTSIAVAVILLSALAGLAQQAEGPNLADLRKEIQELIVIDRNDSTPQEARSLNRKFIRERQARLHSLLEERIAAMNKYQESVRAIIGPEERTAVQDAIRDFEKELKNLDVEMANNPAPAAAAAQATTPQEVRQPIFVPTKGESISGPAESPNGAGLNPARPPAPPLPQATAASQSTVGGEAEEKLRQEVEADKKRVIAEMLNEVRGVTDPTARANKAATFGPLQRPVAYARILAYGLTMNLLPRAQFNSEIESARVDKQVGGAASNAGSTSLVSKGSIPGILGFAVENGGLTRTNQGTTITFRGNPVGLINALTGKGFISGFEADSKSPAASALRKFSFAASFDTSLGDTPNVFLGNKQQLSSYSFRYEFFNHRDPRDSRYATKWEDLVRTNAQKVATSTNIVQDLFLRDPSLRAWLDEARAAIAAATDENVDSVVRAQFDNLEKVPLSAAVKAAVSSFDTEFNTYRRERSKLLEFVANGPIFTVDYVNNRRPGLIDTSNIKFIYSNGVAKGRASVTVNGDATFFNSNPGVGVNRLRDYDFSTQVDIPMGDPRGFGQFDLSFAGQFKRLAVNEAVGATKIANKGNIGTFNLKLEIPIKSLGIKFPVALTYSNRSEFDLKKQLKANFGFAFDPDILYNLLKPYSPK